MPHDPMRPKKRRVVVTGIGAVSALGSNLNDTWKGILEGRSPAAAVTHFDASQAPCKIAYEVTDFALPEGLISDRERRFLNTAMGYGVKAVAEAMEQAALAPGQVDPERLAVCLGMGLCSADVDWCERIFLPKKYTDPSLDEHIRFNPEQLASVVARLVGAKGGNTTIHTACASSGQALGEAYEMIAYGDADVVVTGGADSMINSFSMVGFDLLGAMTKRNDAPQQASRPFDAGRDGFVMGEGACMLVFEDYALAQARGAKILAEICGYGVTESTYRITDLHPEGRGPVEAMQMALDDGGTAAAKVGYINAHGTSTQINDRVEALSIAKVFGTGPVAPKVSSTKSMTGHMIAAAGAMELAICINALRFQVLPPSINVFQQDPACPVALTNAVATPAELSFALSNSIGFGGSNTALVARRWL